MFLYIPLPTQVQTVTGSTRISVVGPLVASLKNSCFFRFWISYQPDRCPHPFHPGLTHFFLIFLMSSISFFSFYFIPEEFSFNSFWISPASIFPVSPLYSQNMDGLGGAWFTEVHLDLLTDARWEEEMGTPVSGVGTNSKFFPQP